MSSTDIATFDPVSAKAFEIRRFAVGLRGVLDQMDDVDRLTELYSVLDGCRHRLRQLREEVGEAERSRVMVMVRIGELLGPPRTGQLSPSDPMPAEDPDVAALVYNFRSKARLLAANRPLVEAALGQPGVSVNALVKTLRRNNAASREAELQEVIPTRADALHVEKGQWWVLDEHRLYCGAPTDPTFRNMLGDTLPVFAYADAPPDWACDYLTDVVAIVGVSLLIEGLRDFLAASAMPYRWMMAFGMAEGLGVAPIGPASWTPVALFSRALLANRDEPDFRRLTPEPSILHDGRRSLLLVARLYEVFTSTGDTVADPYMGPLGLSLQAAERTHRRLVAAESDPRAMSKAIARWGKVAHPL